MRIVPNQQDIVTAVLGLVVVATVVAFNPEVVSFFFPGA